MPGKDVNAMKARSLSPVPAPAAEGQPPPQQPAASARADKFAAAQARMQQQQQQGEQPTSVAQPAPVVPAAQPRRDKFAAQAARQQQAAAAATPAAASATPPAPSTAASVAQPRRDKFAAQAARQQAAAAPRRDKFAAQAAAQQQAASAPPAARRDKFAAQASRNSKFAAMAQNPTAEDSSAGAVTTAELSIRHPSQDTQIQERRRRLEQERQAVWNDLAKAEGCIGRLLQEVAGHGLFDPAALQLSQKQWKMKRKAAKKQKRMEKAQRKEQKREERRLQRKQQMEDGSDDEEEEEEESEESSEDEEDDDDDDDSDVDSDEAGLLNTPPPHERYTKILQELHSLCAPHSHWIQSYKPLSSGSSTSGKKKSSTPKISMYQARVEMRLAQEKRNICQEWLRLEKIEMDKFQQQLEEKATTLVKQEEDTDANESKKRKLDQVETSS
ncbi:expressed unknown protein [Seminavis robusta]|uniref:Uncharacterized protein n=1 Tax=Seminavis robusta TaxID=568900 RepID=A0A9N8H4Y3_9STRA|nr:expressed unknown protein [Seminavis robusta]|eukprot:Sro73_g040500.1 n/a (443) ;mRNA; r:116043-117371